MTGQFRTDYLEFDDVTHNGPYVSSPKAREEIRELARVHGLTYQQDAGGGLLYRLKPEFSCRLALGDDLADLADVRNALVAAGFPVSQQAADAPDIPPALTASEWSERATDPVERDGVLIGLTDVGLFVQDGGVGDDSVAIGSDVNALAALIALANAAMDDEDPRKFRREHVRILRLVSEKLLLEVDEMAAAGRGDAATSAQDDADALNDIADALESMLPPANG